MRQEPRRGVEDRFRTYFLAPSRKCINFTDLAAPPGMQLQTHIPDSPRGQQLYKL